MKRKGVLIVMTMVMVLTAALLVWAVDPGVIALPSGTQLVVKLTNTLSTKGSEEGDPWAGKVVEPIFSGGQEVVPADSTVRGRVTFVKPAGRATGRGEIRASSTSQTRNQTRSTASWRCTSSPKTPSRGRS